jgi:hypothetical protein
MFTRPRTLDTASTAPLTVGHLIASFAPILEATSRFNTMIDQLGRDIRGDIERVRASTREIHLLHEDRNTVLDEVHDHLGLIRQASGLQALTRPRRPERPRAEEEEEEEEAIDRLLADEGEGEEDVDRPRAYEGKGKGRDTGR